MVRKSRSGYSEREKPFPLKLFFSISSLIILSIIAVSLSIFFRQTALFQLITLGEVKNESIAQALSHSVWPEYEPFLTSLTGTSGDEIRSMPETEALFADIQDQLEGLTIVKVKLYDLNGLTVFSTQADQIGADKSSNEGFIMALGGTVSSDLSHRDTFDAFEGEISNRDVIFSYIPIVGHGNGEIEGVIEIYDDVTPLLNSIKTVQRNLVFGVVGILLVLYAFLYLIIHYADTLMGKQTQRLLDSERQFRSVFNGVNDAIIVETTTGEVLDVNDRACEMFGWSRDEFLTKTLSDMVPLDAQALLPEEQNEDNLPEETFETINVRASGEPFPVAITGRMQEVSEEKRLLIVVRDITKRKKRKMSYSNFLEQ